MYTYFDVPILAHLLLSTITLSQIAIFLYLKGTAFQMTQHINKLAFAFKCYSLCEV